MKPVVTNPNTRFSNLLEGLKVTTGEESQKFVINQIVAKLQRYKQRIKAATSEQITELSGDRTLSGVIEQLKQLSPSDAAAWVQDHADLFTYLDSATTGESRQVFISFQPDELLSHTRYFGDSTSPDDYLEEFTQFIKNNTNEIAALNIICTRPADLTREQLKSLKLTLDREGFTEQKLSSAVSQLSNKEITADIISLVRRYAIGSPLISHSERVHNAVDKLKADYSFSKVELGWLSRIEQYLENELLLTHEVFDEDPRFRQKGGFARVDIAFGGKLNMVINEFNKYLYDNQESIA